MNRTELALGRRWCAGDAAPNARCALAASAQCVPSAFMTVAAGSTWTCMKMSDAQGAGCPM